MTEVTGVCAAHTAGAATNGVTAPAPIRRPTALPLLPEADVLEARRREAEGARVEDVLAQGDQLGALVEGMEPAVDQMRASARAA